MVQPSSLSWSAVTFAVLGHFDIVEREIPDSKTLFVGYSYGTSGVLPTESGREQKFLARAVMKT